MVMPTLLISTIAIGQYTVPGSTEWLSQISIIIIR